MKTYVLPVNIEPDEGEYLYAEVPMIPGCALSCYPREHVLESIQDAAQAMLEMMMEYGDPLPEGIDKYEYDSTVEVPPKLGIRNGYFMISQGDWSTSCETPQIGIWFAPSNGRNS